MENRESVVRKVTVYVASHFGGDWKKAFDAYAVGGKISENAIVDLFAAAGVGYAIGRPFIADEVMKLMDADGDGFLSWEEFDKIARTTPK